MTTLVLLTKRHWLLLLTSLLVSIYCAKSNLNRPNFSSIYPPPSRRRNMPNSSGSNGTTPRRSPRLLAKAQESPVSSNKKSVSQNSNALADTTCNSNISNPNTKSGLPDYVKLLVGAGGIYASFLYYGILQEDVFKYVSSDGTPYTHAWFLQVVETFANVVIGYLGMLVTRDCAKSKQLPMKMFGISGAAQVSAKACTSLALANGLSFPVATLAKSGKMAPVMLGSLLLGGASYSLREYVQVLCIIGGTAIVSMGSKKGGEASSSMLGIGYIVGSLVLDGVTAGFQKRLKGEMVKSGVVLKSFGYMVWTNVWMLLVSLLVGGVLGEVMSGVRYCLENVEVMEKIVKFSLCSAFGQSFIFYTIANFDPLVLSTVTTSRKILSVLVSILWKGHPLSQTGWLGIALSCGGVISEMMAKASMGRVKRG